MDIPIGVVENKGCFVVGSSAWQRVAKPVLIGSYKAKTCCAAILTSIKSNPGILGCAICHTLRMPFGACLYGAQIGGIICLIGAKHLVFYQFFYIGSTAFSSRYLPVTAKYADPPVTT